MAVVLHTEVGTEQGTMAEFGNPASAVSAHYSVGLDGTVHQYVQLTDAAWANGILEAGNAWEPLFGSENPNKRTVSIETEDNGQPDVTPVTAAQFEAVAGLVRQIRGIWPATSRLVAHHAISPLSRSCPAKRWLDSGEFARLAGLSGLEPLT